MSTPRSAAVVGCLYMPHFAAWAVTPDSGRHPTIVHQQERVVAASPCYLERGLHMGETVHRARTRFPQARLVLRDQGAETRYRDQILNRLYRLTPQLLPLQHRDWLGCWVLLEGFEPQELVAELRQLLAFGGCADHPVRAMLAALYARAGEISTLTGRTVKGFLRQAPVDRLRELGIQEKTLDFLRLLGLRTLAQLEPLSRRHLQAQFGAAGADLHGWLHPRPQRAPIPHYDPCTATAHHVLEWPLASQQQAEALLEQLLERALDQAPGRAPAWVQLELRYRGGGQETPLRRLKSPCSQLAVLRRLALQLYLETLNGEPGTQAAAPLQAVALTLGGLTRLDPEQGSLFAARPSLEPVLERVTQRFPHSLFRPVHNTDAPFVPEEAFSLAAV